jgi:formylglycine-generating enzyme required for sulfatase activity
MTKLIIRRPQGQAQYYTENLGEGISLDMMLIPSGSFQMGTPDQEIEKLCKEYDTGYFQRESPQHPVNISSFFMGRYPITQAQWKAIASLPKIDIELKPEPSNFKDPYQEQDRWTRPVEQVSWKDAVEFCKRLSRETKREYRLPSEAEWEYACRAGTTTAFHFGETITTDLANYRGTDWEREKKVYPGNYGRGPKGIDRKETTPVGYFKVANAFGLYDMHGSVWEWCEDDYHPNYEGAPTDGSAWIGNDEDTTKVLRGGSWFYRPVFCRSACRSFISFPRFVNAFVGFRVVCSAPRTL